ncbi:MAG: hypothetical protein QOH96_1396 [Blastocatellia bacterium]|jgi:hypothetical protein|nr:hypothetical protein [Blastocatellia bacterium]
MSDLRKIDGIKDKVISNLKRIGIETVDDLWKNVGADFDSGIKNVSTRAQVGQNLITALLIADSLDQLRIKYRFLSSFRNRHHHAYPRIITLALLVVLIVAGYSLFLRSALPRLPRQVVVSKPSGIPAFRSIAKDDLALQTVLFRSANTFSDPDMIVGNYSLTKLPENTTVQADQILSATLSRQVKGSYLVTVPVKANYPESTPRAGVNLTLLIYTNPNDTKILPSDTVDVVLLGTERKGETSNIVVAVHDLEKARALVRASNIVVLEPLQ